MSELKVYHCNEWKNEYTEFYIKSEADKVIADLEESHKMEVEQPEWGAEPGKMYFVISWDKE